MAKRIHRCEGEGKLISEKTLNKLSDVLHELVHEGEGSWRERKDYILSQLSETSQGQLEEVVGWFEGDFR